MSSSRSKWEAFFKDAHIPTKQATEYASRFSDNRVRLDMLNELSKELLHDLGIKAVGDVIAILRHAKFKHAELSRDRSTSPEVVEKPPMKRKSDVATSKKTQLPEKFPSKLSLVKPKPPKTIPQKTVASKAQPSKNMPTTQVKDSVIPANAPALRITTSTQSPTTSKLKPGRMKLSDRFNEFHNEAKRKKLEEERVDEENDRLSEKQPGKGRGTTFTIQVPRKQSSTKSTNLEEIQKVTTHPKVTLVPAQGKALNRNRQSTSIFDRLGKSTASNIPIQGKTPENKPNVFNRLGAISTSPSTIQPVQKVSAIVRKTNNTASGMTKASKTSSVFNRLGSK
ncbi:uncharacterized protein C19orf47-like [Hydractinia symbiolongicarpus]|uniref:uncharacterized protein C19orf47-like n=1 Tax=Hydractinia symbiolongicarpus TaxID=13093 RepID=UPI00254DB1CF|nr:uncharacterized protein C19orf47-like [Hydractinia symbiolongicarpus]